MGHKVHPIGFRLGINTEWRSKWYAQKGYGELVQEDARIRRLVRDRTEEAGVSRVDIERWANELTVTVHAAKPGIVIGRGGQRVEGLRNALEVLCGKKIRLNIQEVRVPELEAYLVGKSIAGQMERQISYRRAVKRAVMRTMQAGAKGIKVICSGRLGGAEIARTVTFREGRVPLHTLRADIDYGLCEARTMLGRIGVKVWIYKGDVFPKMEEFEIPVGQPAGEVAAVEAKAGVASEQSGEVARDAAAKESEIPKSPEG